MRKETRAVLLLIVLVLASISGCRRQKGEASFGRDSAEEGRRRGAEIFEEVRRQDAAPYRKARIRLSLMQSDRPPKSYELEVWRKQTTEETLVLVQVVKPESERDLASLSIQRTGQKTVNIAYAQATEKFYESDSDKQAFGGLTIQELLGEWHIYDFRLLGETESQGVGFYELEGTLQAGARSSIHRVVGLVRRDTFLPAQLRLFDSKGEEIRTFHFNEHRTIDGRPTIWQTQIINHRRKTRASIELLSLTFPDRIDEAIFSREHLKKIVSR